MRHIWPWAAVRRFASVGAPSDGARRLRRPPSSRLTSSGLAVCSTFAHAYRRLRRVPSTLTAAWLRWRPPVSTFATCST
eukprot:scaffold93089_cov72-Phaeocystis_antarctica.AAC.1